MMRYPQIKQAIDFLKKTSAITGINADAIGTMIEGIPKILFLESITYRAALETGSVARFGRVLRFERGFWKRWDELYRESEKLSDPRIILGPSARAIVRRYIKLRSKLPIGIEPKAISGRNVCANFYGCPTKVIDPDVLSKLISRRAFRFERDHIVPKRLGGVAMQTMCPLHNRQKQDSLIFQPDIVLTG